ncbi:MAG: hypothetical protein KGJ32_02645 [Xanthomonadaceae bacterium]|nr:hypothetical protein [Xanthomonadaceae bacterium]
MAVIILAAWMRWQHGLQTSLWDDRYKLWKGNAPARRLEVLEPAVALEMLGYSVECVDSLGNFAGTRSEAAGEIDSKTKVVKVSRRFLSGLAPGSILCIL